jgi:hypothetical protein
MQQPPQEEEDETILKTRKQTAETLLYHDLTNGVIPLASKDMPPKDAYQRRPEYCLVKYEWFRTRLRVLRNRIRSQRDSAASELEALHHDRRLFPVLNEDVGGQVVQWRGSQASRLLKLDLDDEKDKSLSPMELYYTRKEYYENFSLEVFRKHKDQEIKRRKYVAYLQQKNQHAKHS